MATSGLRRDEVCCLVHELGQTGAPRHAAPYLERLEARLLEMPAQDAMAPSASRAVRQGGGEEDSGWEDQWDSSTAAAIASCAGGTGRRRAEKDLYAAAPPAPALLSAAPPQHDDAADGSDPAAVMRAAIEARRAKQEARVAAMDRGWAT